MPSIGVITLLGLFLLASLEPVAGASESIEEVKALIAEMSTKKMFRLQQEHSKPCRGCVPPPPSPSKPPPGTSLRGLTALSEWHAFNSGDEVPLVRQHSQGACTQQTQPCRLGNSSPAQHHRHAALPLTSVCDHS